MIERDIDKTLKELGDGLRSSRAKLTRADDSEGRGKAASEVVDAALQKLYALGAGTRHAGEAMDEDARAILTGRKPVVERTSADGRYRFEVYRQEIGENTAEIANALCEVRLVDERWFIAAGRTEAAPEKGKEAENLNEEERLEEAQRVIYESIAGCRDQPRTTAEAINVAQEYGVQLKAPPPLLEYWYPHGSETKPPPVGKPERDGYVVRPEMSGNDREMLWRAAQQNRKAAQLFVAQDALAGYPWYDRLTEIESIEVECSDENEVWKVGEGPVRDGRERISQIEVRWRGTQPGRGRTRPRRGCEVTWRSDLALDVEGKGDRINDICIHVTRDCSLDPETLQKILLRLTGPRGPGNGNTQAAAAREARHRALTLLTSEVEAARQATGDAILTHVVPHLQGLGTATKTSITIGPRLHITIKIEKVEP